MVLHRQDGGSLAARASYWPRHHPWSGSCAGGVHVCLAWLPAAAANLVIVLLPRTQRRIDRMRSGQAIPCSTAGALLLSRMRVHWMEGRRPEGPMHVAALGQQALLHALHRVRCTYTRAVAGT